MRRKNQPLRENQSSASDSNDVPIDAEFMAATAHVPDAISDTPNEGSDAAGGAKPEAADAIPPELIASALGPSFQAVFHFMATRRGAHWELVEFEKKALIQGWTPIVQWMLARLGSSEQVMLTLALGSTAAIVGGKAAQDIKQASSKASTKMPESVASPVSSASAAPAKQPAQNGSYQDAEE
jgi:hypothetical protein